MVSKEFHESEKINYVFIPEGNKSHAMCVARAAAPPRALPLVLSSVV